MHAFCVCSSVFCSKKMPKRTAGDAMLPDAMLPNSDQMERLMADSYGSCFVNAQSASADPSASVGDSATAVESAHATESAPAIEPTPGNESTPATGEPGRFSFKAVHTFHSSLSPTVTVNMNQPFSSGSSGETKHGGLVCRPSSTVLHKTMRWQDSRQSIGDGITRMQMMGSSLQI